MFGIKFIKVEPTTYLLQYRGGQIVREGLGLSFFYYAPTTSIVAVPVASSDVPFIVQETTTDFQAVTMQGQVTYRVGEPKRLAALLNYTLAPHGQTYASEDPVKLPERVIHVINVLSRAELQKLPLREAIRASDELVKAVKARLVASEEISSLGLEVLGLSILTIKPTPETARALEADTREKLFREAQMEADRAVQEKKHIQQQEALEANIGQTLYGVNDLFIGPRTHCSARYLIRSGEASETQSSSGVIVSTGLGSTGWLKSLLTGAAAITQSAGSILARQTTEDLFAATSPKGKGRAKVRLNVKTEFAWGANHLFYTVREPFPTKTTGTSLVFGRVTPETPLILESRMAENRVIFSDGIEKDFLEFNSGTQAVIGIAERKGVLVE